MNNNYDIVTQQASKHLGKVGGDGYKDQYDPELLVSIHRSHNREAYNINNTNLPFTGYDVWNAYEVSALTKKGLPVSGMMKIVVPADSMYHVESKSIKLYLNSLNMTKVGEEEAECIAMLEEMVERDLSEKLSTEVRAKMFTDIDPVTDIFRFRGFAKLHNLVDLDEIEFDNFNTGEELKTTRETEKPEEYRFQSNLLRSNCRVTNQPDWGDVFVYMKGTKEPDYESIAKYIVSHRKVSHFHEEIAEMLFTHFMNAYNPDELMISCLYTRRGGIDINPIRSTHRELIPEPYYSLTSRIAKTLRQ